MMSLRELIMFLLLLDIARSTILVTVWVGTQYLVALSSRPEYNDKIRVGVLLAPPAYMSHGSSPIFQLAQWGDGIDTLYHLFGLYEFLPHMDIISMIGHLFCSDEHPDTQ